MEINSESIHAKLRTFLFYPIVLFKIASPHVLAISRRAMPSSRPGEIYISG